MKYVLDTDILIYFLNGKYPKLTNKVLSVPFSDLGTTIFNLTELRFGAENSKQVQKNKLKIEAFAKQLSIMDFTDDASKIFAKNKAALQKSGKIVDDFDLLIASVCMSENKILVSNNQKHFSKIKGLMLENWL